MSSKLPRPPAASEGEEPADDVEEPAGAGSSDALASGGSSTVASYLVETYVPGTQPLQLCSAPSHFSSPPRASKPPSSIRASMSRRCARARPELKRERPDNVWAFSSLLDPSRPSRALRVPRDCAQGIYLRICLLADRSRDWTHFFAGCWSATDA